MGIGLGRDFAQLVDHMLWRRLIRVAHPKVDDVAARQTRRVPHRIHFCDNVRRQPLHAVELFVHMDP